MFHRIDGQLLVQFRRDADVEAPLVGCLRRFSLRAAQFEVIVHRAVEILQQLFRALPFVGDERADAHHTAKKQALFFVKFHAAKIALILHRILHIRPSCSKKSTSCLT